MQTWRWEFSLAAAAAIAAGIAVIAARADDFAVLAARQTAMKSLGGNVKLIRAFVESDGDAGTASDAAADIVSVAAHVPGWFPPGTGIDVLPGKTAAKPEIWSDGAKFQASMARFQETSSQLLTAVRSGDRPASGMALDRLGHEACGACHEAFRARI